MNMVLLENDRLGADQDVRAEQGIRLRVGDDQALDAQAASQAKPAPSARAGVHRSRVVRLVRASDGRRRSAPRWIPRRPRSFRSCRWCRWRAWTGCRRSRSRRRRASQGFASCMVGPLLNRSKRCQEEPHAARVDVKQIASIPIDTWSGESREPRVSRGSRESSA